MTEVYNNLVETTENANSGIIIGNRNFYNNDYMVSSSIELETLILTEFSGSAR